MERCPICAEILKAKRTYGSNIVYLICDDCNAVTEYYKITNATKERLDEKKLSKRIADKRRAYNEYIPKYEINLAND